MIDIKALSKTYIVRRLTDADIEDIYRLCSTNPQYYIHMPPPVSRESIIADMCAIPPGVTADDKYYIVCFDGGRLAAVLDLIDGYPEKGVAYIGFFMVDAAIQSCGVGSVIINELCRYLSDRGFASVRLAWVDGNNQAERFWLKNGFSKTGSIERDDKTIITAQKILNPIFA